MHQVSSQSQGPVRLTAADASWCKWFEKWFRFLLSLIPLAVGCLSSPSVDGLVGAFRRTEQALPGNFQPLRERRPETVHMICASTSNAENHPVNVVAGPATATSFAHHALPPVEGKNFRLHHKSCNEFFEELHADPFNGFLGRLSLVLLRFVDIFGGEVQARRMG